jgi:hypothetical protein
LEHNFRPTVGAKSPKTVVVAALGNWLVVNKQQLWKWSHQPITCTKEEIVAQQHQIVAQHQVQQLIT